MKKCGTVRRDNSKEATEGASRFGLLREYQRQGKLLVHPDEPRRFMSRLEMEKLSARTLYVLFFNSQSPIYSL